MSRLAGLQHLTLDKAAHLLGQEEGGKARLGVEVGRALVGPVPFAVWRIKELHAKPVALGLEAPHWALVLDDAPHAALHQHNLVAHLQRPGLPAAPCAQHAAV